MDAENGWILKRVALMTVFAVLASASFCALILYNVYGTFAGMSLGMTISIVTPLLLAPIGSYQYIAMSYRLRRANEKLKVLSEVDPLTDTLNRRTFMEEADKHLALASRHHYPTSLIVLDFDHFKQINDCYGHAVGDDVLMSTVHIIKDTIRETDVLARIGGEEFILLLPHTGRQGALFLAERILSLIRENVIVSHQEQVQVTVSMGGVTCGTSQSRLDELMSRADRLLYRAKQAGRDRIVIESELSPVDRLALSRAS